MASALASGKFFLWDTVRNPEQARWRHLAQLGSQSQHGIWFILPVHGTSHITKKKHNSIHTNFIPSLEEHQLTTVLLSL